MSTAWIAILLVLCIAVIIALKAARRRTDSAERGTVSERWLAEQRSTDRNYTER